MRPPISRRGLLQLLLSSALAVVSQRAATQPSDRGIGGTGFAPGDDRGIGGTGVIGTIRKFGSIVVNDLRIAYAPDADVHIDGRPATPADLKIGQVVRVTARQADGAYSTRAIHVTSEVIGPVQRVDKRRMVVLGQMVSTAGLTIPEVRAGDVVAVSGLRRNDGAIVASLVELRPGAASRVAGPVDVGSDGTPRIGSLRLAGVSPDLIGQRAVLQGDVEGESFVVRRGVAASTLLGRVRTLSLESYVERRGGGVSLGSGYAVNGADALGFRAGRSVRAVLTATIGGDGRLAVDSVRTGGRTYGTPSVGGSARGGAQRGRGGGSGRNGDGRFGRGGSRPEAGPGGGRPEGDPGRDRGAPGYRGPGAGERAPPDFGRDNRGPGGGFGGPGGGAGGGFGEGGGGFGGGPRGGRR